MNTGAAAQPRLPDRPCAENRQHCVTVGQPECKAGQGQTTDPEEKYAARAKPVDHEPRRRLPGTRDHEEDRHQRPDLGEVQPEFAHQPGEQRWQEQMEKVRGPVGKANQADDAGVAARLGILQKRRHELFLGERAAYILASHRLAGLRYPVF
jgi:hypothetical protein